MIKAHFNPSVIQPQGKYRGYSYLHVQTKQKQNKQQINSSSSNSSNSNDNAGWNYDNSQYGNDDINKFPF